MTKSTSPKPHPIAKLRAPYHNDSFDLEKTAETDAKMLSDVKTMFNISPKAIRAVHMVTNDQGLNMEMSLTKLFPANDKMENTRSVPACEYVTVYSRFEQAKLEFITLKNIPTKKDRTIMMISSFTDADKERFGLQNPLSV